LTPLRQKQCNSHFFFLSFYISFYCKFRGCFAYYCNDHILNIIFLKLVSACLHTSACGWPHDIQAARVGLFGQQASPFRAMFGKSWRPKYDSVACVPIAPLVLCQWPFFFPWIEKKHLFIILFFLIALANFQNIPCKLFFFLHI